jgi:hypothetical protein
MSIKALKLKTGEELIADVETKEGDLASEYTVLGKPFTIHIIPSEQGIGLQLLPWAIYLKEHTLDYPTKDIIFCEDPSTGVRNQYAEMTGLPTVPDDTIIVPEGVPNLKLSE